MDSEDRWLLISGAVLVPPLLLMVFSRAAPDAGALLAVTAVLYVTNFFVWKGLVLLHQSQDHPDWRVLGRWFPLSGRWLCYSVCALVFLSALCLLVMLVLCVVLCVAGLCLLVN